MVAEDGNTRRYMVVNAIRGRGVDRGPASDGGARPGVDCRGVTGGIIRPRQDDGPPGIRDAQGRGVEAIGEGVGLGGVERALPPVFSTWTS